MQIIINNLQEKTMNENQITELVNKAIMKDNYAMEALYNAYYKDVLYVCKKLNLNDADANDIAQDTFIDAFTKLNTLNDKGKFKQWVCRIANNKALNLLKRNNIINLVNIDDDNTYTEIPDKGMCAEEQFIETEVANTLRNIIEMLPLEQKITVFMYYYEDMTAKEIADAYNCSENTVRSRLNYAKKFIASEVDKLENNGIKLRCTALLPFLYLLFTQEQKAFAASIPAGVVPPATAVIAKTMALLGNNAANVATTIAATNVTNTATVVTTAAKSFSVGKIIAVTAAAIATISAAVVGFALLGNDDDSKKDTDNEYVSSEISATELTTSDVVSNETNAATEDTTEKETETEAPTYTTGDEFWDYYPMDSVSLPEVTYTPVEYYNDGNVVLTANIANTFFTHTPEEVYQLLNNNDYIKNQEYIFTTNTIEDCDITDFSDVGVQKQYSTTHSIVAYPKAHVNEVMAKEAYKYYQFHEHFSIDMTTDYTNYTTPNKIKVDFENISISRSEQENSYQVLSIIFGENIAKYLAYAKDTDGKGKDSDFAENELYEYIEIGETTYLLSREVYMGYSDDPTSGRITYTIEVTHDNESESYCCMNYTSILTPEEFQLNNYILGNFGSTDINNISSFGSEYMKHGVEEEYIKTITDGYSYKIFNYPDGTVSNLFTINVQKSCNELSNLIAPSLYIMVKVVSKDSDILSYEIDFDGNMGMVAVSKDDERDYSKLYAPFINQLKGLLNNEWDLSALTLDAFLAEEEISFEATYLDKPCKVTIAHEHGVNMADFMTGNFEIDIIFE